MSRTVIKAEEQDEVPPVWTGQTCDMPNGNNVRRPTVVDFLTDAEEQCRVMNRLVGQLSAIVFDCGQMGEDVVADAIPPCGIGDRLQALSEGLGRTADRLGDIIDRIGDPKQ